MKAVGRGIALARAWVTGAALLSVILVLTACADDPAEHMLNDYRHRLARSLKQALVAPPVVEPAQRPSARDLTLSVSDQRIGLLDFLKLYSCSLGRVVGERNSILGKVAPASLRLFNELDFLRLAPVCVAQLREQGRDTLAQKLAEAHAQKRDELPIALWHATLGGEEYAGLWQVPLQLGDYPQGAEAALAQSLAVVDHWAEQWLAGHYDYDAPAFEQADSPWAGRLPPACRHLARRTARGRDAARARSAGASAVVF